ncbi:MAG: MBL fold metallo-hydrolase [Lentisphaeria bacterium]|nr:MBL fold metallo-hydrolase [Lentisphaeria bacterium]
MQTAEQTDHTTTNPVFGFTILGSGSNGNATVIHGPEGNILLDAGFSRKELERRMRQRNIEPSGIKALLLTHEHTDHVQGCRVFADHYNCPVYLTAGTENKLPCKNCVPAQRILIESGAVFQLCGLRIEAFSIPHDVEEAVAYTFHCGNKKLGYATDLGMTGMMVLNRLQACNALVLESNYEPSLLQASGRPLPLKRRIMSRHGHLSNAAALEAAEQLLHDAMSHIVFAHLSTECNDENKVYDGLCHLLQNCQRHHHICPQVAKQHEPLDTVWL